MTQSLKTSLRLAAVLTGIVILWTGTTAADGILIPRPVPGVLPQPEAFSIKYHRVNVSIDGQTATTTIDQVFVNNNDADIEGTYIFPIPESASITDFAMWMNGKKVTAELLEAHEARKIYEDIVRRMKDPALLEYAGLNMFKASVYPIPRRGETRIELSYQELLHYDAGLIAYRYPLNTEKFSATNLDEVTVAVDISSDIPINTVYSPSHETDIHVEGRTASCGYEEKDVKPDRDFLLYYGVSEEEMGLNLMTHRLRDEHGFFALLLAPGQLDANHDVIEKNVVFVVDVSGSMEGEKIQQAREALEFCVRRLNERDRFNIITFATAVDAFQKEMVTASDQNVRRALRFISEIRARGGTAINKALLAALDIEHSNRPQMIIFVTDGEPTVGETDIGAILENVQNKNEERMRVFPFGVGYDVNTHLLDRLSSENRGTVAYVKPEENIETKVASFFSKVSEPVLSDISLDFGHVRVRDIYPETLPDIFNGSQLVLFGRYEEGENTAIRLTGEVRGREREFFYDARFHKENEENDFIPRLWASRKIAYLVNEIRLHGEKDELVDEVIELSKEYGIITPYTSYLIVEEEPELAQEIRLRPGTVTFEDAKRAGDAWSSVRGGRAVELSADISEAEASTVMPASREELVRHISGKAFYGSDDDWRDGDYEEGMKIVEIEFMSREYFDLLSEHPGIGKFLSLGKNVTFVFEGTAYRISS
jgi:Ca-activated chloride channel family protein